MHQDPREKNILLTGATGFIGAYVLRTLFAQGYTQVRALHRPESSFQLVEPLRKQVTWIEGDLLDPFVIRDALKGVQWVIHAAAVVSFRKETATEMERINIDGTAQLIDLALEAGIEKIGHISSVAAIGRSKERETISEESKWKHTPLNTRYGITKFRAEQEVWRGAAEGLSTIIINPSIVIGSGCWDRGTARFFPLLEKGFNYYPAGVTGLVDVRDVARMIVDLMASDHEGERFIANADNWTYGDFFTAIASALGVRPPKRKITPILRELAWRLSFDGRMGIVTKETARQSARTFFYDNTKSLKELDFEYTPIAATIRSTAQQYLESKDRGWHILP